MDVIHSAIWVSDLEQAREFFVDILGLTENWSFTLNGVENVYVGGEHGEVQLRYDPTREPPEPDRSTLDHIAIEVTDVDAECDRISAQTDSSVLKGPMTVKVADARVAFLEVFDGYVVELVEALD